MYKKMTEMQKSQEVHDGTLHIEILSHLVCGPSIDVLAQDSISFRLLTKKMSHCWLMKTILRSDKKIKVRSHVSSWRPFTQTMKKKMNNGLHQVNHQQSTKGRTSELMITDQSSKMVKSRYRKFRLTVQSLLFTVGPSNAWLLNFPNIRST